jgi:cell division protease FtsH
MVCEYGMSKLGPLAFGAEEGAVFLGRDYTSNSKDYSEQTAREIDQEVRNIIQEQYERVRSLLTTKKEQVEAIAKALMEREILDAAELKLVYEGQPLPDKPRVHIMSYSEKEKQKKDRKVASIFGSVPPKPAPG